MIYTVEQVKNREVTVDEYMAYFRKKGDMAGGIRGLMDAGLYEIPLIKKYPFTICWEGLYKSDAECFGKRTTNIEALNGLRVMGYDTAAIATIFECSLEEIAAAEAYYNDDPFEEIGN